MEKHIFSQRLKSARRLEGLSLRELSVKVDNLISHNAIKKYEDGDMLPDSEVLIALAKALNRKPDYFFSPFRFDIGNISFRKKVTLGAKKEGQIKEQVRYFLERYFELENLLQINSEFTNPVNIAAIRDGEAIEKASQMVLREWDLGFNGLQNILEMLEDHQIKVFEIQAPDTFDGLSAWVEDKYPVIVLNQSFTVERKRFNALHELGHLILSFSKDLNDKQIEKLCHRFAGAMMIPKQVMISELGQSRSKISLMELITIKEHYGISIQAIMARALDLGIIDQNYFIRFRRYISGNREEKDLGSYAGKERCRRFDQLLYRAATEEVISLSKAALLADKKLAEFKKEFVEL